MVRIPRGFSRVSLTQWFLLPVHQLQTLTLDTVQLQCPFPFCLGEIQWLRTSPILLSPLLWEVNHITPISQRRRQRVWEAAAKGHSANRCLGCICWRDMCSCPKAFPLDHTRKAETKRKGLLVCPDYFPWVDDTKFRGETDCFPGIINISRWQVGMKLMTEERDRL